MLTTARVRPSLLAFVALVQMTWTHSALATTVRVTINHDTHAVSVEGLLELRPNDKIEFKITETIKSCFLYNATPVAQTPPATSDALRNATMPDDEVTIITTHQRRIAKYKIEITRRPEADAKGCEARKPLEKDIAVTTLGWEVGVAGAFTIDGLRSPKYFLAPQADTDPQSYVVTRNRGAEDSTNTNLAIMLHVFNTSLEAWRSMEWAPISFGVGFSDTTRYMAGTSLKLGDVFFLTGGYLIGKVDRLPTGLQEGSVTTDANAIASNNQKTDSSWFLGFSYQFGSTEATKRLKAIFGSGDTEKPTEQK